MLFGNKSISVHIIRGILGFAAVYGSLATLSTTVWPSVVLLPAALYFLKGCPMCWVAGLIETITMSRRRHGGGNMDSQSALVRQPQDGSCCGTSDGRPA